MSERPRVLFVDDEKRVLNSLRGMFRRKFDLFLTTEGATAVQIAAENPIDVIVADQRMPGMTGIEVLGKVKEVSPTTIRILLTGYANPNAVEGSINVGEVFRYLCKPCPPKVLSDTLDLAVAATRASRRHLAPELPEAVVERRATNGSEPEVRRFTPSSGRVLSSRADESGPEKTNGQSNGAGRIAKAVTLERSHRKSPPALRTVDESGERENDIKYGTTAEAKRIGVVVYTVDALFAETAIRTLSSERSTTLATSFIKVMQTIEQDLAGILITDFSTNRARLQRMIGALKQYLPELVTIVVSNNRDTTEMIGLINYGQVFRYILKPVSPERLRSYIDAATFKHLTLRNNPELLRRHAVESLPSQPDSSASMNHIIRKMQDLQTYRFGT